LSTSTRSSPRSASVAITVRIGIVPADLALHAQAVLREAVSNTVRHAYATELTVTVTVGHSGDATDGEPTAYRSSSLSAHPPAMGMRRRGMRGSIENDDDPGGEGQLPRLAVSCPSV